MKLNIADNTGAAAWKRQLQGVKNLFDIGVVGAYGGVFRQYIANFCALKLGVFHSKI
jgi:hypothetical protein